MVNGVTYQIFLENGDLMTHINILQQVNERAIKVINFGYLSG